MKANNISIYLIRLILIGGKVLLSLYLAKVLGLEFLGTFTLLLGAVAIVPSESHRDINERERCME